MLSAIRARPALPTMCGKLAARPPLASPPSQSWSQRTKTTAAIKTGDTCLKWSRQKPCISGRVSLPLFAQVTFYTRTFLPKLKNETRWRKEVKRVGSPVGAALAIRCIHFGARIEVVWEAACLPIVTAANLQPGTAQHTFHRMLGKRYDRKIDNCFSLVNKMGSAHNVSKARLAGLLHYIDDVFRDRPKKAYISL